MKECSSQWCFFKDKTINTWLSNSPKAWHLKQDFVTLRSLGKSSDRLNGLKLQETVYNSLFIWTFLRQFHSFYQLFRGVQDSQKLKNSHLEEKAAQETMFNLSLPFYTVIKVQKKRKKFKMSLVNFRILHQFFSKRKRIEIISTYIIKFSC